MGANEQRQAREFEQVRQRYWDFVETHLGHVEERVEEWVASDEFDRLLKDTVQSTYPPHEQDRFMAHFRGLIGLRHQAGPA